MEELWSPDPTNAPNYSSRNKRSREGDDSDAQGSEYDSSDRSGSGGKGKACKFLLSERKDEQQTHLSLLSTDFDSLSSTDSALRELDVEIATAIFEVGLKNSSPKVLMGLMPPHAASLITTEHLKSHLQKGRINEERSKEEFRAFFRDFMQGEFWASLARSEACPTIPGHSSSNSVKSSSLYNTGSTDAETELDSDAHISAAVSFLSNPSLPSSTSTSASTSASIATQQPSISSAQLARIQQSLSSSKHLLINWQSQYREAAVMAEKLNRLAYVMPGGGEKEEDVA